MRRRDARADCHRCVRFVASQHVTDELYGSQTVLPLGRRVRRARSLSAQGEAGMDTYRRRGGRSEAGTTIVEAAIVLLTFLMLVFGVFEAGRFLNTEQVLTNAAREGARLAVTPLSQTNNLPTHAEIIAHVDQFLADAHITGATISAPTQVSV